VSIDQSPADPDPGERVDFSATASDPDGTITSIEWDTDNDGQVEATGDNASRRFPDPGVYQVSATVTDNRSTTNTTTVLVSVGDGVNADPIEAGYSWDAEWIPNESIDNADAGVEVSFDFADNTTIEAIDIEIYERGNENNTIYRETIGSGTPAFQHTEKLRGAEANKTWVVEWTGTINGEAASGRRVVGPGPGTLGGEIPAFWRHVASVGLLFVVSGLFGGVRSEWGAVVLPVFAGLLVLIGWLPPAIGGGVVVLAAGVGAAWLAVRQPTRS
jgi:PKD repeat protein